MRHDDEELSQAGRQAAVPQFTLSLLLLGGNWVILAVQLVSTGSRMRHAACGMLPHEPASCLMPHALLKLSAVHTVDVAQVKLSPRNSTRLDSRESSLFSFHIISCN